MQTEDGIYIDGAFFTVDDLTFREQREMREHTRTLAPDGDIDSAGEADLIPAFICVLRKRSDPTFTLEQALEIKPSELIAPDPPKRARKK